MHFLPDSKIPEGVFEIANEMCSTVVISKTWKARNQAKISGNSELEIRVLYFGSKIEETAKNAVSLIGMQYNKLYRSPAELPSGTNSMSPLYRAIKNCLFMSEKKVLYMQEIIATEKSAILMDDFFPKHWLTFHMCFLPINDRFKEGL